MDSMRTAILAATAFVALAAGCLAAQEPSAGLVVSVKPGLDVPLPPDPELFRLSGGTAAGVSHSLPFFRPLSAGVLVNYHLARMQHATLGNLGSLSVISAEGTAELRWRSRTPLDLYLGGGAGLFYALLNDRPSSWVSNFVWNGHVGIGLRATPSLSIDLQGEYRRYESLYHLIGISLGAELRLGRGI